MHGKCLTITPKPHILMRNLHFLPLPDQKQENLTANHQRLEIAEICSYARIYMRETRAGGLIILGKLSSSSLLSSIATALLGPSLYCDLGNNQVRRVFLFRSDLYRSIPSTAHPDVHNGSLLNSSHPFLPPSPMAILINQERLLPRSCHLPKTTKVYKYNR
jgi:hypothetical protein